MARRQYKRISAADFERLLGIPGLWCDGDGLNLDVGKTLTASWVWRFIDHEGDPRTMGLGSAQRYGPAEARRRHAEQRALFDQGYDPIELRREKRAARVAKTAKQKSVREVGELWIAAKQAGWKSPVHRRQVAQSLRDYVYSIIGRLPIPLVDTAAVLRVLEQNVAPAGEEPKSFWLTHPRTAERVRGRLEGVLDLATSRELRAGANPARWKGHLETMLAKPADIAPVRHLAAMPYREVPGFVTELRQEEGVIAAALDFDVLTVARAGRVLNMQWDEYDPAEQSWVVSEERQNKRKRQYKTPLVPDAVAILDRMRPISGNGVYVFPSPRKPDTPMSEEVLIDLLRRLGYDGATVHGFRSTFSTWCAERTTITSEEREMALGHSVGPATLRAYMRGDLYEKRRAGLQLWADHCAGKVSYDEAEDSAKVIPIRKRG